MNFSPKIRIFVEMGCGLPLVFRMIVACVNRKTVCHTEKSKKKRIEAGKIKEKIISKKGDRKRHRMKCKILTLQFKM